MKHIKARRTIGTNMSLKALSNLKNRVKGLSKRDKARDNPVMVKIKWGDLPTVSLVITRKLGSN
jgi:hypothetical protein